MSENLHIKKVYGNGIVVFRKKHKTIIVLQFAIGKVEYLASMAMIQFEMLSKCGNRNSLQAINFVSFFFVSIHP